MPVETKVSRCKSSSISISLFITIKPCLNKAFPTFTYPSYLRYQIPLKLHLVQLVSTLTVITLFVE